MTTDEILLYALTTARINLEKDGDLLPVALMFQGESLMTVMPMPFKTSEEKYEYMTAAGCFARKIGADVLITVCDAAMRQFKSKEEMEYIKEHYDTERPLAQPKSQRTECLVAQVVEFPSGTSKIRMLPYTGEHHSYQFQEMSEVFDGEGDLLNAVKRGWSHINAAIESGELQEGVEDLVKAGFGIPVEPPSEVAGRKLGWDEPTTPKPTKPVINLENIYKAEVRPIQRN